MPATRDTISINDQIYFLKLVMENENHVIVTEEEAYTLASTGNLTYNEIVSPARNIVMNQNVYKPEWQTFPEFQSWLQPIPDDKTKAWCQACEKVFKADLKSLRVHGVGRSHTRMVQAKYPHTTLSACPPPAAVYNVITDRKGTYGLGILSKTENNTTTGSTLYVNPTNPNTNVLTCDPKQDKDNYVVVSMPKGEIEGQEQIQELRVQFEERIKNSSESANNGKLNCDNKRNSRSPKQSESFAEDLIETEDIDEEDEEEDEEDDDDSIYDFESKVKKAKCSMSHRRSGLKRNSSGYSTMSDQYFETALVTRPAPFWKAKAIVNGHVSELKITDYLGRYLVLFFYPQDFAKPCSKEITDLSDRISEFRSINTEIVACSVDSYLTHQVWCKMNRADGGVAYPKIPLLSDYTHEISKSYGCYLPQDGHTLRAHYVIDTKGILRHIMINDIQVTRNVTEILNIVQAFQRVDECEKHLSENDET